MKFTKEQKLILAISLQIFIIIAIVIFKLSVLTGGKEILFHIMPVDPKDYLRGDYITFQYTGLSYIDSGKTAYGIRNGDEVYIEIKKTGNFWKADYVSKNKPIRNVLFIKGKVIDGGLNPYSDNDGYYSGIPQTLYVNYGIEQYFIPEGKGADVNFGMNAYAKVMVDDDGNAVLKQVYIDEKPWP